MQTTTIEQLVYSAQKGNVLAREQLINTHQEFIARVCSRVCKRYLTWENDDELSIGLISFNKAIDLFENKPGSRFTSFAAKILRNKLIDYFRSQNKYKKEHPVAYNGENNQDLQTIIDSESISKYEQILSQENLSIAVERYRDILSLYSIDINELPKVSPKHSDTRVCLISAAVKLVQDKEMINYFSNYKQLPLKDLCSVTGLSRKVLSQGRKYVIAIVVILMEPELAPLKNFTKYDELNF